MLGRGSQRQAPMERAMGCEPMVDAGSGPGRRAAANRSVHAVRLREPGSPQSRWRAGERGRPRIGAASRRLGWPGVVRAAVVEREVERRGRCDRQRQRVRGAERAGARRALERVGRSGRRRVGLRGEQVLYGADRGAPGIEIACRIECTGDRRRKRVEQDGRAGYPVEGSSTQHPWHGGQCSAACRRRRSRRNSGANAGLIILLNDCLRNHNAAFVVPIPTRDLAGAWAHGRNDRSQEENNPPIRKWSSACV